MKDLICVFAILGIFLFAYGISMEVMLHPPRGFSRDFKSITRLFSRAYLESLGELQLDEINDGSEGGLLFELLKIFRYDKIVY